MKDILRTAFNYAAIEAELETCKTLSQVSDILQAFDFVTEKELLKIKSRIEAKTNRLEKELGKLNQKIDSIHQKPKSKFQQRMDEMKNRHKEK